MSLARGWQLVIVWILGAAMLGVTLWWSLEMASVPSGDGPPRMCMVYNWANIPGSQWHEEKRWVQVPCR